MNVLFWMSTQFDRHTTSEHLLKDIITQLCLDGHKVHVLQKDTGGDLPKLPEELVELGVTTDLIKTDLASKKNLIGRFLSDIKYLKECKKYITPDFDAVFIQSSNVAGYVVKILKKKLKNAKITFNVQDTFPYNAYFSGKLKGIPFKILASFQRYAYKNVDSIITISEDMKELLIEDGVDGNKIEVVYNWSYNDELVNEIPKENKLSEEMIDKKRFNIIYAGNIGIMQNVDIIIDAAKLLKDEKNIWFTIFGDGVHKDKLVSKAKSFNIQNISFYPFQDSKYALDIYSSADINIIPLDKNIYKTALPSKTATCLACRKPLIFAIGKDSKFGEKIQNETGVPVVDSDDPLQLKEAILDIKKQVYKINTDKFYLDNFSKLKNRKYYSDIITKKR